MIFDTLYIQNFMSIRTAEIKLDGQGMVLITGENKDNPDFDNNGAGKSTIIEALSYVLYGRTIRGLKGDDIVNCTVGRNCRVMLDITDDDGTNYRVSRYRKHNTNKNKFCLHRNAVDITPKSEADFTKAIGDLLQMDYLSFTSSILYSAQSFKFTTSTDAEMKSAFDAMLGFDMYSKCLDKVKNDIKDVADKSTQLSFEKSNLSVKIEAEKSNLETFKQMLNEFEENKQSKLVELDAEVEVLSKQLREFEKQDDMETQTIREYEQQLDEISAEIEQKEKSATSLNDLKKEIHECESDIQDYENQINTLKNKIYRIDIKKSSEKDKIDGLLDKKHSIEIELSEVEGTVGSPCPTCGRPLDKGHISDIVKAKEQELQNIDANIDKINDVIQSYDEETAKYNDKIAEITKEKSEVEQDLQDFKRILDAHSDVDAKISELNADYHKVSNSLRDATKANSDIKRKIDQLIVRLERISEEIDETNSSVNPYSDKIQKSEQTIESYFSEWQDIDAKMNELYEERKLLDFWVKGFSNSGIKSLLLDDITPYLNRRANKYLHKLSSNHMEIIFSTQSELKSGEKREKFNIEIKNSDGGDSYLSNSSGERRRIDIAINLALQDLVSSRNNKKLNIMFLDEVMDTLDESGVSNVMELIKDISAGKSSVFVISHNEEIKSMFTNVIKVTKEDGCSTVEVL